MDVQTDHQIVAFGTDRMILFDSSNGQVLVTADRIVDTWTISADGVADTAAQSRQDAVTAMADQALAVTGNDGCSTLVPHGLLDLP